MLGYLRRYCLKDNLSSQLKELYASIAIREFAISMVSIFEPIYIYKIYGSIQAVLLFYAITYLIYFFTIPLGAKAAARHGFEHCISASVIFVIFYYLTLSQLDNFPALIIPAMVLMIADKTLLRPAYHANIAHYGKKGFRGREVSGISFLETVAKMTGPLLGGIILTIAGFQALFLLVSLLGIASMIPMLSTREKFTPQYFSYRQAMRTFLNPAGAYKRQDSLAYMGYGEELIIACLWPVFIFLSLPQLHIIGLVTSSASVMVAAAKLYSGRLSDKLSKDEKKHWVHMNAALYSALDLARPFAHGSWGIFSVNFFSDTFKTGIVYPFFTHVYSAAGENKNFLRYGVFYEMSLAAGKAVIGIILLAISLYFVGPVFWSIIFLLAALWSLLYTLLKF